MNKYKTFSEALDDIFCTVSKKCNIRLIIPCDMYGYILSAGGVDFFVPDKLGSSKEAEYFKGLFYKKRRVKNLTVGGLERYLLYLKKRVFMDKRVYLSDKTLKAKDKSLEKCYLDGIDYDLTDDGTGKKYDNGKPMVGTLTDVFSRALMAVGACIEYGTHKYPNPKNWQLVDDGIKRYRDAMVRHLLKYNAGIDKDEETKLPHLAHMVWNALAILELYMQEHKDELDKDIFK